MTYGTKPRLYPLSTTNMEMGLRKASWVGGRIKNRRDLYGLILESIESHRHGSGYREE